MISKSNKRKKLEWSKLLSIIVIFSGLLIVQESFVLMYLCIIYGFTSTAAWLTAAVGLAEAVIGLGLTNYISLCKKEHTEGGITYEKARANNFVEECNWESPNI